MARIYISSTDSVYNSDELDCKRLQSEAEQLVTRVKARAAVSCSQVVRRFHT